MATTTLAATLNSQTNPQMSELQPASRGRILVIADNVALRKILQRLFSSEGYEVDVVPDAAAGLALLGPRPPSAVIVDLEHPASSGCDLCRKIADLIPSPPLVILSASTDVADRVLLLRMGADDYVTIPFSPRELVARLRGLISRASGVGAENLYVFEDVMADFSETEISPGGETITITAREFKTLAFSTRERRARDLVR